MSQQIKKIKDIVTSTSLTTEQKIISLRIIQLNTWLKGWKSAVAWCRESDVKYSLEFDKFLAEYKELKGEK